MKKTMSRVLALLLTLMLLLSALPTAFAEEIIELGSRESVEDLLFEQVKQVFPTASLENQYIYVGYYEKLGRAENVSALLETLTSDQLIAFTNFKAENDCTCYDENGECICAGEETCTCLCHEIDAFLEQMQTLIAQLQALDIEAAKKHIYALRFDEVIDRLYEMGLRSKNPLSPDVTVGSGGFEASLQNSDEVEPLSLEAPAADEPAAAAEVGDTQSEGRKAADTYNSLQEKNNDTTAIGASIGSALNNYASTETVFANLYSDNADFANYVAKQAATDNANLLAAAVNDDIMLLAEEQASGLQELPTKNVPSYIKMKLFNYDKAYLDAHSPLRFWQNVLGDGPAVDSPYPNPNRTDGYAVAETNGADGSGAVKNTLGTDGYPIYSKAPAGNTSGSVFFDETTAKAVHVRTFNKGENIGLFNYNETTGTYEYDSKDNAAWYNPATKQFVLYNAPVCPAYTHDPKTTQTAVQEGNFLPFNRLIDEDNNRTVSSYVSKNGSTTKYVLSGEDNYPDMWFGMSMEFDFYMPKDGKYMGDPMVFEFLGDDDVLVYIDDVLVLDISGIHAARKGTIDFSTGDVSYHTTSTNIYDLFKNAGKEATTTWRPINNTYTFADYTKHTFKFFYLERGGNISYCKLKFNIPQLPPGGLTVEKKTEGQLTDTTRDAEYTFKLTKKEGGTPVAGAEYSLINAEGVTESTKRTTDQDGKFTLKAGQKAHFEELAATTYEVSEDDHAFTDSTKVIVTDEKNVGTEAKKGSSADVIVSPGEQSGASVVFTNTLKTTTLTVEKKVTNPRPQDDDAKYTFKAKITASGTPLTSVKTNGGQTYNADSDGYFRFQLEAGQSITFVDLPIGAQVSITETDTPNSVNIEDFNTTASGTNVTGGEQSGYTYSATLGAVDNETKASTITFTNTPRLFQLTITKEDLDMDIDENQSTMYKVTRVGDDTGWSLVVAINGNSSVTINDLPAGDYKVEELTDWSWRYDTQSILSSDGETDGTVMVDDSDNRITFTNERTEEKWLDGDCYSENAFTAVSGGGSETDPVPASHIG